MTPPNAKPLPWWIAAWAWALHGLPTRIPTDWEDFEPWALAIIDEARPIPVVEESEANEWPMTAWAQLDLETKRSVRQIIERLASHT